MSKFKNIKKHDYPDIPREFAQTRFFHKEVDDINDADHGDIKKFKEIKPVLRSINHGRRLKELSKKYPDNYREVYDAQLIEHLKYLFKKYPKLKEDDTFRGLVAGHNRLCKALETESVQTDSDVCVS